jgi:hypothetical protein
VSLRNLSKSVWEFMLVLILPPSGSIIFILACQPIPRVTFHSNC